MQYIPVGSRAIALQNTLDSLNKSGFLAWHLGNPSSADDIGIYYFIPLLAHCLNINTGLASNIFWITMLSLAVLVGFASIFALYKNWLGRAVSLYFLCQLSIWTYSIGDLYMSQVAITIALIPLSLYLINKEQKFWVKASAIFLCGSIIGIFHFIRSYSEFPILVFLLLSLFFNKNIAIKLKITLTCLLAIGFLIPFLYFKSIMHRDAVYFNNPTILYLNHHPFWHPVYLGLGYLPNPYGIQWNDRIAADKVHSIQKNAADDSPLYESILRNQVFSIVEENPLFVIQTIFAKAQVLFDNARGYLITAFILTLFFPKGWRIELAFWSLLFFSALPGLLVMPNINYILGFISAAMIYMLVSIGYALDKITPRVHTLIFKQKSNCEAA